MNMNYLFRYKIDILNKQKTKLEGGYAVMRVASSCNIVLQHCCVTLTSCKMFIKIQYFVLQSVERTTTSYSKVLCSNLSGNTMKLNNVREKLHVFDACITLYLYAIYFIYFIYFIIFIIHLSRSSWSGERFWRRKAKFFWTCPQFKPRKNLCKCDCRSLLS